MRKRNNGLGGRVLLAALSFGVAVLGYGCASDVGESCETPGAENECVDGAVCDKQVNGAVSCLKLCTDQADCAANENCNGVSDGSDRKACHPKDQTSP